MVLRGRTVKTNISFPQLTTTFVVMNEHFRDAIHTISKGDTSFAESFFRMKGGRKYLENITLILINTLAQPHSNKEEMYLGFVEVLDRMEQRIQHQKEGQEILKDVFQET